MFFRKFNGLLLTTVAASMVFTACSSQNKEGETTVSPVTGTTAAASEPLKLSIMLPYYTAEAPSRDAEVLKKLQETTNTKIEVNWVPFASYNDKLNVMLASSSDLPTAITVLETKLPAIMNSVKANQFWEVGPYIKDYPNLNKRMDPGVITNASVDGKLYGLFRSRALARSGFLIRQDWLDNLNLKMPTTIDELYQVMKAFTEQDPDKNGKNDTYGLVDNQSLGGLGVVKAYFGSPNQWKFENQQMVPEFITAEFKDSLNFFRKLYQEKILHPDFATTKNSRDVFIKGQTGILFSVLDDVNGIANLYTNVPNSKVDIGSRIIGPKGIKVMGASGFSGQFMFPKSVVKTEAELKKLLAFFDQALTDEMDTLMLWGIENKHYTLNNGEYTRTAEQSKAYSAEADAFKGLRIYDGYASIYKGEPELVQKYKQSFIDDVSFVVLNDAEPFVSQTYLERGADLNKIISDAKVKYVFGELDEAGFDKAVQQWRSSGGDKVIQELTEAYKKANNK